MNNSLLPTALGSAPPVQGSPPSGPAAFGTLGNAQNMHPGSAIPTDPVSPAGGFAQSYRNALMDWRGQRPQRGAMQPGDFTQQLMGWVQDRPHFRDFRQPPMATPGVGGALQPMQPQPQHNQIVSQMPVNSGVGTTMGVIGAMGGGNGQFPAY
jgi:hypothetical protein